MEKLINSESQVAVAALIPEHWDLTANTLEDIIFFGKITIRQMIKSWQDTAKALDWRIKDSQEKLIFFRNKTAAAIREIATQYENPEFPCISVLRNGCLHPEPLDDASINRKEGATTFNVCGWCKYARGARGRYSYYIIPYCDIKSAAAGSQKEKCHFNTPCFLKEAPDEVFDEIRKGLIKRQQEYITEKKEIDKKIEILLALEKRAEKKPVMPNHRPYDWFKKGDSVVCYLGNWKERIIRDDFAKAKVIHHGNWISVYYDERIHTGDYLEGHGGSYGENRPEIMHLWEFEYLLKHPEFAHLWATKGTSKHLEGFDAKEFLDALSKRE